MGLMLRINIPKRGQKVTNGDLIKILFPDLELHQESDYVYLTISKGVYLEDRDGSWWNAPYKEGYDGESE